VQNPLALHVLEGEFDDGDTVIVDRDPAGTGLVFRSGDPASDSEAAAA
jgi:ATP-dependent Clp protease ATP-binding subunit ClpB